MNTETDKDFGICLGNVFGDIIVVLLSLLWNLRYDSCTHGEIGTFIFSTVGELDFCTHDVENLNVLGFLKW